MDVKQLFELGNDLFSKKASLNSLHQDIAENFYYERATFALQRSLGMDFAANSMTGFPAMCRRELGSQFGTILRPTAKSWFHTGIRNKDITDNETRQSLQAFEETQRRAMYDPKSFFTRAAKEADHDFAAFGQCAISVELNRHADGLLYRCWHLRDMAWAENEEGTIGSKFRKWKAPAQALVRTFGKDKLHSDVQRLNEKTPFDTTEVMHIVVEADMYDDKPKGRPHWSIWYDTAHQSLIEATPIWTGYYRIPRWQTVSDSQYSYSPAVTIALPDARLLQAMTFSLLEASEKAARPPMVATVDAVRSDLDLQAGGVVWVDPEYDERMGEALRPLAQDFRGFNLGVEMNKDVRSMITEAFYLNKLTMPSREGGPEMTAYEMGQRVQQYIRDALPLFEPMELDYNAGVCEDTFELLWRNGAMGSPLDWPKELRGADISFTFESPLHDAIKQQKGQILMQGEGLVASAIKVDPSAANLIDARTALRDALDGIGVPARWMRSDAQVQAIDEQQAQAARTQQILANISQGAAAAKDLGAAQASVAQAQPA